MGKTLDLLFIGSALFLCVLLVLTFSGVATQPAALIALTAEISGTVLAERLMARRPRLSGRVYYTSLGSYPTTRCFVNTKWLEQCNLEMPTTLDGFIVSDNVQVVSCAIIDTAYANTDHNPVDMTFVLGGE